MEVNSFTILKFRKDNSLDQKQLAEMVGCHINTISNYETGGIIPIGKIKLIKNLFKTYKKEGIKGVEEDPVEYKILTVSQKESSLNSNRDLLTRLNKMILVAENLNDNTLHSMKQLSECLSLRDKVQMDINYLESLD